MTSKTIIAEKMFRVPKVKPDSYIVLIAPIHKQKTWGYKWYLCIKNSRILNPYLLNLMMSIVCILIYEASFDDDISVGKKTNSNGKNKETEAMEKVQRP